ncbi:MAG: RNA methyltransferase PUA domain-containing protein, partial [bacterium]
MQRYFVKQENCSDIGATIVGPDFHHVKNVMRMKKGAEVTIVDATGRVHLAVLRELTDDAVHFDFVKVLPSD